ncbi:MAG TPA: response regulator [Roseiflexaceae bacterium]|nr:response regulator [Roseiflexaceae bacterium]
MSILVVEDDEQIRRMLVRTLVGAGHTVLEAEDGSVALEYLRTARPLPSLLLLDLMMPQMDGITLRRAQMADPKLAGIPVIMLSVVGDPNTGVAGLNALAVVSKPFHIADVLTLVSQALRSAPVA